MSSYADVLRKISEESKTEKNDSESSKPSLLVVDETVKRDSLLFFNQIKNSAKDRMDRRAKIGSPSANIFEFKYREFCAISETEAKTRLYFVNEHRPGYNYYKIYDLIQTDYFKSLLDEYSQELGAGVQISIWHPKGDLNVIEVIWDITAYNTNREKQAELRQSESKSEFKVVKHSKEFRHPENRRNYNNARDSRDSRDTRDYNHSGRGRESNRGRYSGRGRDNREYNDSRDYRDY